MSLDFQSPDAEDRNAGVGATNSGKVPIRDINLGASTIVYYSDGTYDVFPNSKLPASSGGSSTSTNYSVQDPNALAQSAQQNNANIAEQQRQFNEKLWYDKARGDQQQQLSQELGRGGLDVSRGNLGVSQGQLALSQQKQAQDYYLRLSEVASNPRNFVQNYFLQRGQQPPGNASQFGNAGRMPSYAPSQGQPYAAAQQPQQAAPAAPAQQQTGSPYNPATDPNRGTRFEGLSGFNTDGTLRLAPNDPDAEGLMAKHPGQYRIGFAQGGVVPEPVVGVGLHSGKTYTFGEQGPEGVVPASYLPKFLQNRHGQQGSYASGGIIGADYGADYTPHPGDPYADPYAPTGPADPSNPYSGSYNPYDVQTTQEYGPQVPTGYGATNPQQMDYTQNPAPPGFHWSGGTLVQDAPTTQPQTNPITPDTFIQQNYTPPPPLPLTPQTAPQPIVAQPPQGADFATPDNLTFLNNPKIGDVNPLTGLVFTGTGWRAPMGTEQGAPIPPPTGVTQPLQLPQGGGLPTTGNTLTSGAAGAVTTSGAPAQLPTTGGGLPTSTNSATPTANVAQPQVPQYMMPRDVAVPGTFGAPIGNRPQFLPGEDQGSVLSSLLAGGALPPFLSRLFGQQHGVDSVGTNKPQTYNLPADVPLVSKLAWTQMTPSEQQGLLSYASSYGVTPEDYIAAIESFSPQGGAAQSPLFGNQTRFNRQ